MLFVLFDFLQFFFFSSINSTCGFLFYNYKTLELILWDCFTRISIHVIVAAYIVFVCLFTCMKRWREFKRIVFSFLFLFLSPNSFHKMQLNGSIPEDSWIRFFMSIDDFSSFHLLLFSFLSSICRFQSLFHCSHYLCSLFELSTVCVCVCVCVCMFQLLSIQFSRCGNVLKLIAFDHFYYYSHCNLKYILKCWSRFNVFDSEYLDTYTFCDR